MYHFTLNGREVPTPENWDGLLFKKKRHATFFGFLHAGATADDPDAPRPGVTWDDEDTVAELRAEWERAGVEGKTAVEIWAGSDLAFSGFVDYTTAKFTDYNVSAELRPEQSVTSFLATTASAYALDLTTRVALHAKPVVGASTHFVNPTSPRFTRRQANAAPLAHYVPLETDSANNNFDLEQGVIVDIGQTLKNGLWLDTVGSPAHRAPFVRNLERFGIKHTKGGLFRRAKIEPQFTAEPLTVTVRGLLRIVARSAAPGTVRYRLEIESEPGSQFHDLGEIALTTKATERLLFIDQQILLPPKSALFLRADSEATSADFEFYYAGDSFVGVEPFTPKPPVPATYAACLSMFDALSQLVEKQTDGLLSFASDLLTTGEASGLMIAPGKALRGVPATLNVSFETLFAHLNARYNVGIERFGNVLRLETKADLIRRSATGLLEEVDSLTERSATEFLFSRVKAGYETWQAETPFGADEFNSTREYQTALRSLSKEKELNLLSPLIASGYLIEEGRSRQTTNEAGADWNFDDKVFVIDSLPDGAGWKARRNEGFTAVLNTLKPETAYNLSQTPARMVWGNGDILKLSGRADYLSGTGNTALETHYEKGFIVENFNMPFGAKTALFQPVAVEVEGPMELATFAALPGILEVPYTTGTRRALLLSAEWTAAEAADSPAKLTLVWL